MFVTFIYKRGWLYSFIYYKLILFVIYIFSH